MYPVEVAYLQEPTADFVRKAAEVAWNINLRVSRSFSNSAKLSKSMSSKAQVISLFSSRAGMTSIVA